MDNWSRIEQALPMDGETVLVCANGRYELATFHVPADALGSGGWFQRAGDTDQRLQGVTCWQYLPPPTFD